MTVTIYNMVGSDDSWFSPYGWRVRALALFKQVPVTWKDIRPSELGDELAFAGGRSTPLLVDDAGDEQVILKDSSDIVHHLEAMRPDPTAFPSELQTSIALFGNVFDFHLQLPGFIAWSPDYFSNGVIAGEDQVLFRQIVQRATGATAEENRARQETSVADFRRRLAGYERQLTGRDWLLGPFTYADILLLSCLKCFGTVLRGVDHVIGEDAPKVRAWYDRTHTQCHITDPY